MSMTKGYEEWGIVGILAPIDANAVSTSTAAIDMSLWSQIMIIVSIGVTVGTSVIKAQDSATSGGTYVDITGKTYSEAATDDGLQRIINVLSEEMNAGARYIKINYVFSANSNLAALIILGKANNPPATDNDLSTVTVID